MMVALEMRSGRAGSAIPVVAHEATDARLMLP